MHRRFGPLVTIFRGVTQRYFKQYATKPHSQFQASNLTFHPPYPFFILGNVRAFHLESNQEETGCLQLPKASEFDSTQVENIALMFQNLLKKFSNSPNEELEKALDECGVSLNEDLVLNVLRRHSSDWNSAFRFFNWVSRGCNRSGYSPESRIFNEMLGILGKMKRFEDARQVFDEMSTRGFMNERAYGIMVHRYASAHRIDDAIEFFYKRKHYGLKLDLIAYQTLLMSLCRYKHVEAAEFLFHSKKGAFQNDIKTWNIILNGWCVVGKLLETKRFWNDIIRSKCKPDKVTYAIFINSLCKSGKISTAVKLFHAMWRKGCTPDVVICNSVIDGLCFKKRIPEALQIFQEMNDKECQPDVATYNCLIKHLCKIQRMDKVSELVREMEKKGGDWLPNSRTYSYLLNSLKNSEEVSEMMERMKKSGCKITGDIYNLLLRLYMNWNCDEQVESTWSEMERSGMGPDQRSYTVMIHRMYDHGRIEDAMSYFNEMTSKGMIPEERTMILVNAMDIKLKETEAKGTGNNKLSITHVGGREKTYHQLDCEP